MLTKGKAIKYGDNVDTDVIIPARYLNMSKPEDLARHCMEDIDKDFVSKVRKGDMIVAGSNFGCGSSREHAPIAIQECGVSCVIAKTFARIFYRNAINIGLAVMECVEASEKIKENDIISIDFNSGIITNTTRNEQYQALPFPDFAKEIIAKKGLLNFIAKEKR